MTAEQFAATRSARLVDFGKELRPIVVKALDDFGSDWYSDVVTGASVLWLETYEKERGSSAESAAPLQTFQTELRKTLAKTSTPESPATDGQVDRVTNWIGTYAVNSATLFGHTQKGTRDKEWVAMDDDKTRPAHRAADRQKVSIGAGFTVGGVKTQFPGEPVGPIENWINCRCLVRGGEGDTVTKPITAAATAAAPTKPDQDAPVDPDEQTPDPDAPPADDDATIDDEVNVPFHGVAAPIGVTSGDGRRFAQGGQVTWRDLPLPFFYQDATADGHNGAVRAGVVQQMWIDEASLVRFSGVFKKNAAADTVIQGIVDGDIRSVSVDLGGMVFEFSETDTLNGQPVVDFTEVQIAGLTAVGVGAFAEAYIALGEEDCDCEDDAPATAQDDSNGDKPTESDVEEEFTLEELEELFAVPAEPYFATIPAADRKKSADAGHALPDGSFPIENVDDLQNAIQAIGRAKDPAKAKAHIKKRASDLGHPELIPDAWAADILASASFAPGTHDGPGWITEPIPTGRIRRYWTHGKGAAKIRWGVPGDFNRCRRQLAKYIKNPDWLAGACANMHKEAIKVWPGQEDGGRGKHSMAEMSPSVILAAADPHEKLPASWFRDPKFSRLTPLTVTSDGRIFGHLAQWDVCHVGMGPICTTAPRNYSGYSRFMVGLIETDEGDIPVGSFVKGIGHAAILSKPAAVTAFYDKSDAVFADVAVGEDEFGVWYAGALRSSVDDALRREIKATAKMSGDWRPIRGEYELLGAVLVAAQGYPSQRTAIAASMGYNGEVEQTALIGAGIVDLPAIVAGLGQFDDETVGRIADEVLDRMETRAALREAAPAIAELNGELAAAEGARLEEARRVLEDAGV